MMSRIVVIAAALALTLPASASAQILGARVTAAGGIDAILKDGSTYVPTYVGQMGLEWRQPDARGALRLGLMHYRQNRDYDMSQLQYGCTSACRDIDRFRLTGITFDGSFDLTRTRFRPYLVSGLGVYRRSRSSIRNYQCDGSVTPPCAAGPATEYRKLSNTAALHSGLGFASTFNRVTVFTELRVMLLADGQSGYQGMVPLTLGVKF
jgi:hypothetical protein